MERQNKMVITDILTNAEIKQAFKLWRQHKPGFAQTIRKELIEPNLARIEQRLGQPMDAGYLAYAVEYVFSQAEGK